MPIKRSKPYRYDSIEEYNDEFKKYDDKLEALFEKQYDAMIYGRNKELGKLDILQAKLERAKEDLRIDRDVALGIRKPSTRNMIDGQGINPQPYMIDPNVKRKDVMKNVSAESTLPVPGLDGDEDSNIFDKIGDVISGKWIRDKITGALKYVQENSEGIKEWVEKNAEEIKKWQAEKAAEEAAREAEKEAEEEDEEDLFPDVQAEAFAGAKVGEEEKGETDKAKISPALESLLKNVGENGEDDIKGCIEQMLKDIKSGEEFDTLGFISKSPHESMFGNEIYTRKYGDVKTEMEVLNEATVNIHNSKGGTMDDIIMDLFKLPLPANFGTYELEEITNSIKEYYDPGKILKDEDVRISTRTPDQIVDKEYQTNYYFRGSEFLYAKNTMTGEITYGENYDKYLEKMIRESADKMSEQY